MLYMIVEQQDVAKNSLTKERTYGRTKRPCKKKPHLYYEEIRV